MLYTLTRELYNTVLVLQFELLLQYKTLQIIESNEYKIRFILCFYSSEKIFK